MRQIWIALGVIGICSHYSTADFLEIVKENLDVAVKSDESFYEKMRLIHGLAKAFGFGFDYLMEELPKEKILSSHVELGNKPDSLTLELLKSEKFQSFTGLKDYPEYLRKMENFGMMSEDSFHSLVNLLVSAYVDEIKQGVQVKGIESHLERGDARAKLAERCCDVTAIATIATLHAIKPFDELHTFEGGAGCSSLETASAHAVFSRSVFPNTFYAAK